MYSALVHHVYGLLLVLVATEHGNGAYRQLANGVQNMTNDTAWYHGDLVHQENVMVG